jgi:thioredoxin-dependent peroxiredoxin
MRIIRSATVAVLVLSGPLVAQSTPPVGAPPEPPAPEVGQAAPDFTAPLADANGPKAEPVTLSKLRGRVVVLAFYPGDRTSGCTAELTKFRDEHAKLFGDGVVVLPVSVDNIDSHVSWAKEMSFPFALVADPELSIAKQYGSANLARKYATRTIFVIDGRGVIQYRDLRFGALSEDAYTRLAEAVTKAKG